VAKAALGERLLRTALSSRSDAYRWLRENHAEIAAAFASQSRPSWRALAANAPKAKDGNNYSPDVLRKAWGRLEIDLKREADAKQSGVQPAPPPQPPATSATRSTSPSMRPVSPRQPVHRDDDDPPPDTDPFDFSQNLKG